MLQTDYNDYKIILDIGALFLTIGGVFVTFKTYFLSRRREMIYKDYEMRCKFIESGKYTEIQSKIEHEDQELENVLKLVDGSDDDPYAPGKLTKPQAVIHQQLDDYINYLDAVSLLIKNGNILTEDTAGMWDYYLRRVLEWEPLKNYVRYPPYGWDLVIAEAEKAAARQKARDMLRRKQR
ncbi:MAG: hypothetical protein G8237_06985 [Magnetococcales bacterium]|nr:hypothetical protein [Magnetococcales bacterium]NGZ06086.1 hypothetical protein [Magnetococcales bacterium]